MASHNTKPGTTFHKTPPAEKTERNTFIFHKTPPAKTTREETAEFLKLTLPEDELSIDDDSGIGGDPYNSTGQHVLLKSRRKTD